MTLCCGHQSLPCCKVLLRGHLNRSGHYGQGHVLLPANGQGSNLMRPASCLTDGRCWRVLQMVPCCRASLSTLVPPLPCCKVPLPEHFAHRADALWAARQDGQGDASREILPRADLMSPDGS